MSLSNFISHIKSKGVSKPNRFRVRFALPVNLHTDLKVNRVMELMCENANLPGRILTTSGVTRHGVTRKIPNQTLFENMSLTFKVDGTMDQRKIFDNWHNIVQNSDSFDFNFPSEYRANVTIEQLDEHSNPIYGVQLLECYPESVQSMELGHGIADTIHKVNVDLVFTKWISIDYGNTTEHEDSITDKLKSGVTNRLPWLKNNKYLG